MRLLLDTHVIIWWTEDDRRLGAHARALIEDSANEAMVSVVSFWEMAVKVRAGKMKTDLGRFMNGLADQGFSQLGLEPAHLMTLGTLPTLHRDPFDHLLVAQAIVEDATFLTADRIGRLYPVRSLNCGA